MKKGAINKQIFIDSVRFISDSLIMSRRKQSHPKSRKEKYSSIEMKNFSDSIPPICHVGIFERRKNFLIIYIREKKN